MYLIRPFRAFPCACHMRIHLCLKSSVKRNPSFTCCLPYAGTAEIRFYLPSGQLSLDQAFAVCISSSIFLTLTIFTQSAKRFAATLRSSIGG